MFRWINRGLIDDQASWQGLPFLSQGPGHCVRAEDVAAPSGFSDRNGTRAHYSCLASVSHLKGTMYVMVAASDDNGATWSAPVIATTKTSAADFNDKNWIAVDNSATSPYFGRVHLRWTEFRSESSRISTDSRNGVGCADLDAYQKYLRDNRLAVHGDMAGRLS